MKPIQLLLCFASAAVCRGQTVDTAAAGLKARGAFFALSVANMQSAVRWYSEKLGLKATMVVPKTNGSAVTVLEGEGLIVELVQNDGAKALSSAAPGITDPIQVYGIVKAGVMISDFDKTVARLRGRGVTIAYGPFPSGPNKSANVIIRDNEGNLIQLVAH